MWFDILKAGQGRSGDEGQGPSIREKIHIPDSVWKPGAELRELVAPWLKSASGSDSYMGRKVNYGNVIDYLKNAKDEDLILAGYFLRSYIPKIKKVIIDSADEPSNPFAAKGGKKGVFSTPIKTDNSTILGWLVWRNATPMHFLSFQKNSGDGEEKDLGDGVKDPEWEQNAEALYERFGVD